MLAFVRRQWCKAVADRRKAPVCFSVAGALGAAGVLSVALFICRGNWILYHFLIPVVECFHPGVDAPDSWALGIAYALYFVMGLGCGSLAFLWAGVWRAYRKERRDAARRGGPPPDAAAGRARG